jgi:hypothetical protein
VDLGEECRMAERLMRDVDWLIIATHRGQLAFGFFHLII